MNMLLMFCKGLFNKDYAQSIALPVARKIFGTKRSDVVLQVSSKRSWAVKCILGTANANFTAGWKEFVLDNNLKVGDVCVFERISTSKLLSVLAVGITFDLNFTNPVLYACLKGSYICVEKIYQSLSD
ncbi:hypothetical protein RND71_019178 [Anisodus tanguticus]|uniref:TF-B3 domain-containing protein n=1 Tax=Anisodus tanguticus TaxID=243964 RepID=A0AAE1RYL5_9SOLA|nr:hypothetical protein RND71_019178 [Anisodus tanguticus]